MFKTQLKDKLQKIFLVKKVTFDAISPETNEQDCIFIEIEKSKNTIKDGQEKALINGKGYMVSKGESLPYGFFSKAIRNADPTLTKDLFFYDIEINEMIYRDIQKRSFSFLYFYTGQYDPDTGSIESIELTTEDTLP